MSNKGGRPQKITFDDALLSCIAALSKSGKTNNEIAAILGISKDTLYRYKKNHVGFSDSLKTGKEVANSTVEQSLFSRAVGYSTEEVKLFQDPKTGKIKEHTYIKHYPPDPTSMIFWLKNCAPQDWRDKIEHEHGGGKNPISLAYDATQKLKPAKKVDDDE